MIMLRTVSLLTVIGLSAWCMPAAAQDRQVVYWPLVTDGLEYRRVAYPAEAGTLMVMADTTVVLEAREASVAYWPITREYLSDITRSTPIVAGTLEIQDEGGKQLAITPGPYVVWHPEGVGTGVAEIVHGPEAVELHESYVRKGRAAAEAGKAHQRLVADHHAAVEAWLKLAGQKPAELPPPPPEFTVSAPEPYPAYATVPETAAVVSLPAGNYTLQLRDNAGNLIAGSERRLISFAPRATGTGYVVRPGDRWTQPAVSFDPRETIYTTGHSALYVQPVPVAEYAAQYFARLFDPQSVEQVDPSLSIWVPRALEMSVSPPAQLALWDGETQIDTVPVTGFRVVQSQGVARGYTIEEFISGEDVMLKPDFAAMKIPQSIALSSISLKAGDAPPTGERRVRRVVAPIDQLLFLPALLPILIGLLFHWRKRRCRGSGIPITPLPRAGSA